MFIGHQTIRDRFNTQLPDAFQGHAFLFTGLEHVGKYMFAEMLAHAYIERATEISDSVQDVSGDVLSLKPETVEKKGIIKQREIPIGAARRSVGELALSSRSGGRRVLIIDDAHMLTTQAQNALLKTIEEPKRGTVIILVTHEVDRILSTIRSRCQQVSFNSVSVDAYQKLFPESTHETCEELHILSFGCPGRAVRMVADKSYADKLKHDKTTIEEFQSLTHAERLRLGELLSKDVSQTIDTLECWAYICRTRALKGQGQRMSSFRNVERLDKTITLLRHTNANSRLLLENICLILE